MNKLVIAYMVENEENIFFKASLESSMAIADEILIIEGGSTDKTLELINKTAIENNFVNKIKIIHNRFPHEYIGADGYQRNSYLKWLKILYKDWYALVLDGDEVISDNAYLLKETEFDKEAYSVKMEHFIGNLGFVDDTLPEHFVPLRFFKVSDDLEYPEIEHAVLHKSGLVPFENVGIIKDVIIYHLGGCKGIDNTIKKFYNNLAKSPIHSKEFLKEWRDAKIFGTYKVRPFVNKEDLPFSLKKLIGWEYQ